ncbi:Ferritin-like metal-binding protein YciE [Chitinophaga sp. YR573]|uniref:YciE/YciF ferroxidase family protein n=1 Tax=Chitinophaga sp. YR573 TaxID=1881040 RepID=UPI0008D36874|nr:ferritin-like domain-containing protein [Chitinophaga sp. YR573]SEW13505.1 Ferritin-like metal-binding protein YciE [Chitinophaga sp. YR573]
MATKTQVKNGKSAASTKPGSTAKSATAKKTVVVTRSAPKSKSNGSESKFHKLFMDELKDIYWAEKALVKALGKMQKAATSEELVKAITDHQGQTKGHVERLEQVFELLGQEPKAKKCEAMSGLIAEGQEVVDDTEEDSAVRDAGIIICSQKIEHYEISAYGSLRTLANVMGHADAADIFSQTLSEEKDADSLLTQIAESSVNEEASAE